MATAKIDNPQTVMNSLTTRQRQVLDGLLQHKTSKEIARDLDISPHTVDQRIRFAKEKLGVCRRSDLASQYRQLRRICEKSVYRTSENASGSCDKPLYEESRIDSAAISLSYEGEPEEAMVKAKYLADEQGFTTNHATEISLVPTIFEGPIGGWTRTGAVVFIAAAAIFLCVGGLAMFEQLSRLMT